MWLLAFLTLVIQSDHMLSAGASVAGVLSDSSPPSPVGRRAEFFGFRCVSGLGIRVDATSGWDNMAFILAPDGRIVARDDDSGGGNNARIAWACPGNDLYRIGVASYHDGVGGSFTVQVTATTDLGHPPAHADGATTLGTDADVAGMLPRSATHYLNHPIVYFAFRCRNGQTVRMELISSYDNLLYVFGPSGVLQMNDDANGTNAGLIFRCDAAGSYRIGVAGQNAGDVGGFRLILRNLSDPDITTSLPRSRPGAGGARTVFPGSVASGMLRADAPPVDGRPASVYILQCQPGLPLRVDVTSPWDNMVSVVDVSGTRVAFNDNVEGTSNARLAWRCPDAGLYRIVVASANPVVGGMFTLSVQPTGPGPAGAAAVPDSVPFAGTLYVGARVNGNLTAGARRLEGRPTDLYVLTCTRGATVRIDLHSEFDNLLTLLDAAGHAVASNDDARGTDASLLWTCPDAAEYRVGAGARYGAGSGRYVLIVR